MSGTRLLEPSRISSGRAGLTTHSLLGLACPGEELRESTSPCHTFALWASRTAAKGQEALRQRSAFHSTAACHQLPALNEVPCCRSSSPGNLTPCKPPFSASIAQRMSVMAIAERLVARVSFSQKLTGPERGPSRYESQRGCRRGMEGGAPWGGSPKQHPPSPVWKTHHLKRKYELTRSRPGARRHDTNVAPASTPGAPRADSQALAAFL